MKYTNTKDNPSDALTKALSVILHGPHDMHSMGMYSLWKYLASHFANVNGEWQTMCVTIWGRHEYKI